MAKRKFKRQRRIESDEVQGEGSYVIITSPTFEDLKEMKVPPDLESQDADEQMDFSKKILANSITEWNWVGDDDKLLTIPTEDPEVLNDLPFQELMFLINTMQLGALSDKNFA